MLYFFQDDGEHEVVRQHLQQQVVRRDLHHTLPQQEGNYYLQLQRMKC